MSSALPACCLEAAGGGPCIPIASRILKDRSKPWQGTARANSCVFHGGKYSNWDEVSTANAVEAVRRGESVRRAAELYSVPRSTLSDIQLCCIARYVRLSASPCRLSRAHASGGRVHAAGGQRVHAGCLNAFMCR